MPKTLFRVGQVIALALLVASETTTAQLNASTPRDELLAPMDYRQQVEEDWLRQAKAWQEGVSEPVSTRTDARGACDGIKNGQYGFHTGLEANPWWQVDMGEVKAVVRVVVFNRLDYAPGLHNADTLRILTSEDGKSWTLRHENKAHFGGISGAKPLQLDFPQPLRARFIRLQVPSAKPIFFHLDEVEVYGPGESPNFALHRPADQSSISQWSTSKPLRKSDVPEFPTAAFINIARSLAADLAHHGSSCTEFLEQLNVLERKLNALPTTDANAQRALYLQVRSLLRELVFLNPVLNFNQLLFVKRFTQESYPDVCLNHMPWVSRPGGDICILSSANGTSPFAGLGSEAKLGKGLNVRAVLNRALGPGHVHGMDLHWDGTRVVFGFARAKSDSPPAGWLDRTRSYELRRSEEPIHIFEIGVDGRNLRQLTHGEWSDLDPTYAPNGDIVFVSERCGTSLQCNEFDKDETSCNLYVMKPDGSGIRRLSVSKDGDYLPHTLDDGSIAYTRWEYHERSWAFIQSIWTLRPDGTGADAIYKQHFVNPWALEDTRSIPGSKKLVSIAAGHHTLAVGPLVVVNPAMGINNPRAIGIVTPGVLPPEGGMDGVPVAEGGVQDAGGYYSTPWALSDKYFLVSYTYGKQQVDPAGYALYLVDVFGNKELVYRDPAISCFIPTPLRSRSTPPAYADLTEPGKDYALCSVSDASFGSDGIAPERVRYIRISEPIGWPYDNQRGGSRYGEDHRYGGPGAERKNLLSWTPIRILGDVPVERDGSAYFKVPVDTAVYFQLLDENRMELRRMRSFISFQPGEVRACVGCHETRGVAPVSRVDTMALNREPAKLLGAPWGDRPVSFLRDIQPVLDEHCVRCHSGLKPANGLDFGGGLVSHDNTIAGYGHNRAYETIMAKSLVCISKVREQDASITPPLAYGSAKSKLLLAMKKEPHVKEVHLPADSRLRLSMWIDANAPYHDTFINKRPATAPYDLALDADLQKQLTAVHRRRCSECHKPEEISRLDWIDLHRPAQSLFLAAPRANTNSKCQSAAYKDTSDPDYRLVCQLVEAAVKKSWNLPRRDLEALAAERKTKTEKQVRAKH